jgi:hypothetical protein
LGEVIKNTAEREEALGEPTEFAARVGILQFQTEQLEEMNLPLRIAGPAAFAGTRLPR